MATAPERVDPVFGDALAGNDGMTDPASSGPRRDTPFDVFPDALSALPLPALTLVMPTAPGDAPDTDARMPGAPMPVVAGGRSGVAAAAGRPTAGRTPAVARGARRAPTAPVPFGQPSGPVWAGYPPPGQPAAVQPPPIAAAAPYSRPAPLPRQTRPAALATSTGGVLAPGSGRRPVAGVGYTPPTTTAAGVVRPPAYLPQNSGLAQLRAAVQQARGTGRPPASPPSAVRPAPPPAARRGGSGAWALFVFVIIFLVGSGVGQQIVHAITQLLHHR